MDMDRCKKCSSESLPVTSVFKKAFNLVVYTPTCQNTASVKCALAGLKLYSYMTLIRETVGLLRKSSHLPASFSSSSWGVDLRLLDWLPEGLRLLENHWLKRLADTGPSPKTSSIIWKTKIGVWDIVGNTNQQTKGCEDKGGTYVYSDFHRSSTNCARRPRSVSLNALLVGLVLI